MDEHLSKSEESRCKICGGTELSFFAHTALCANCGVLLYWPYPKSDDLLVADGEAKTWPGESTLAWYSQSSFLNHDNFTSMLRFASDDTMRTRKLDFLDYGGGGGQFALVCKSHFPQAEVYITDIADDAMLDEWKPLNRQIPFKEFADDSTKFDIIFLNDVFEHLSDPVKVLEMLAGKLKDSGRIFIDTPKQFWIYPFARLFAKGIYKKILNGTVSIYHLQIWSKAAFGIAARNSGLRVVKYEETSEYTMPATFYLNNMGITNPVVRFFGGLFYRNARYIARNKIQCVLEK